MGARTVKYGTTVILVLALAVLVDWSAVFAVVAQAQPQWIAVAAMLVGVARLIITWRWSVVLRSVGYRIGFRHLFRVVSAGIGMGSLLPTSAGPDLARGVLLHVHDGAPGTSKQRIGKGRLVSSLLLDRYAATLGTLLIAVVGAIAIDQFALAGVVVLVIFAALAIASLAVRYTASIALSVAPGALKPVISKVEALAEQLRHPEVAIHGLLPAVFISTLLTLVRVGVFYTLYLALGFTLPVELTLFVIPMLLVVLMLPVSVGGFGLREWLLVISFADVGVPTEVSVSVGILAFLLQFLVSVPAMIVTLLAGRNQGNKPIVKHSAS